MVIFNNILFLTFFILKHFLKLEDENWAGTWWKSVRLWKTWLGRLWTCLPYFWAVKVGNISCNLKEVVLRQIPKDPTLHHNLFSIICKWFGKTPSQRTLGSIPNLWEQPAVFWICNKYNFSISQIRHCDIAWPSTIFKRFYCVRFLSLWGKYVFPWKK